jgi:hypothetical protein
MTINVTLFGDEWVLQAADRRISGDGHPSRDQNKAIVLMTDRVRASAVYTGLANHPNSTAWVPPDGGEIRDSHSTDVWLAEVLADRRLTNAGINDVLGVVREASDERWKNLPAVWVECPLLISICGWDLATGQPIGGQVSNFLEDDGAVGTIRSIFAERQFSTAHRADVVGDIDPNNRRAEERHLDRIARVGRSKERVISESVAVIRRAAARTETVSNDPVVVWLPLRGDASAHYCPPDYVGQAFAPNFVNNCSQVGYTISGVSVVGGFGHGQPFDLGDHNSPQSLLVTTVPRKTPEPKDTKARKQQT